MSSTVETPRTGQSNALQAIEAWRSEYPFAPHYLPLANDLKLQYVDEGPLEEIEKENRSNLPTIVCVHGNPTWSFYYRSIVSGFSKNTRVIVPDHIGCGLSDKPQVYDYTLAQHTSNLIQLLDHLQLKNITLVVHDWGGAIGLGAAVQRPQWIRNIMVLNTAAFPPPYIPWRIAACRIPWIGSYAIRHWNAFAWTATFMAIDRLPRLSKNARDGLLAPYNSPENRIAIDRFVQDIPGSKRHPTWKVLEDLELRLSSLKACRIRFVWGMKDWCFIPACMERLQRHWPDATRHELKDVGHYVMEEAPDEVAEQLRWLIANS